MQYLTINKKFNEEAILVVMDTNELVVKIRAKKIQVERSMML